MPDEKTGSAASASRALQPAETNPLDFVPDKIPFDTPYGPPISLDRAQAVIHAAVAEAKKRNWKGIKALMARGFHKPGDVENRLGYYLGQVAR
jgi:hypothetical protein